MLTRDLFAVAYLLVQFVNSNYTCLAAVFRPPSAVAIIIGPICRLPNILI